MGAHGSATVSLSTLGLLPEPHADTDARPIEPYTAGWAITVSIDRAVIRVPVAIAVRRVAVPVRHDRRRRVHVGTIVRPIAVVAPASRSVVIVVDELRRRCGGDAVLGYDLDRRRDDESAFTGRTWARRGD